MTVKNDNLFVSATVKGAREELLLLLYSVRSTCGSISTKFSKDLKSCAASAIIVGGLHLRYRISWRGGALC